MGNFFVSYDLNGKTPTHSEMDKHVKSIFGARVFRVLETVWLVHTSLTKRQLFDYFDAKVSRNDRLLVIEADDAVMRNLLVPNQTLQAAWVAPLLPPAWPRPPAPTPQGFGLLGRVPKVSF